MECKTKNVAVRVLEATPGHKLHRKSESLDSAYFTDRVYLGAGDSPDNYTEVSEAEAAAEIRRREAEAAAAGSDPEADSEETEYTEL
jgi:hypothetical protein